jgi:hypothetical protein
VTKGLSNKEVANQLFVTEKTVKFHLTNIYKKMNVKSRAQLIVWCLPHLGFVEREEKPAVDQNNGNMSMGAQTIPSGTTSLAAGAGPIGGIARRNDFGNDAGV